MSNSGHDERTALLAVDTSLRPTGTVADEGEHELSGNSSSATLCDEAARVGKTRETPFPWRVALSLYILTCITPLTFDLIFPFVNQMILDNGITHDPERVGFYSGLIESIFALTSFVSIMPCAYLSDHVGRKPVILIGTLGLAISTALFGMAKTYWLMILTRLIGGTLGGTSATMRVMLVESVERSQQGLAFSGSVIAFRMGQIVGQPMGGLLSHPDRYFEGFDTPFWRKYPYALPCFVASGFAIFGVIYAYFFAEETLPSLRKKKRQTDYGTTTPIEPGKASVESGKAVRPTVRSVLTPQVVGALISSSFLAFSSEVIFALFPLVAFTPIESGGLGYNEAQIGAHLGFRSINNVLVIFLYAPLERRVGSMTMYKITMAFWPLTIAFFPFLNALARHGYEGTWMFDLVLGVFVTIWSFACLSWTASSIVLNDAAPSAEALSVVNGIGQMALTLPFAVAPAFITSVFAFSIKHESILGGNLVYVIQLFIAVAGAGGTLFLKEATHDWREGLDD